MPAYVPVRGEYAYIFVREKVTEKKEGFPWLWDSGHLQWMNTALYNYTQGGPNVQKNIRRHPGQPKMRLSNFDT